MLHLLSTPGGPLDTDADADTDFDAVLLRRQLLARPATVTASSADKLSDSIAELHSKQVCASHTSLAHTSLSLTSQLSRHRLAHALLSPLSRLTHLTHSTRLYFQAKKMADADADAAHGAPGAAEQEQVEHVVARLPTLVHFSVEREHFCGIRLVVCGWSQ